MVDRLKLVEIDTVLEIIEDIPALDNSEMAYKTEVLQAIRNMAIIEVNIPHEYFELERGN